MSVVDRSALEASPLADLHAIASELSIDGYRRLRRPELIDAILARQGSDDDGAAVAARAPDDEESSRSSRSARSTGDADNGEEGSSRRRRGRRGGRSREAQESGAERD